VRAAACVMAQYESSPRIAVLTFCVNLDLAAETDTEALQLLYMREVRGLAFDLSSMRLPFCQPLRPVGNWHCPLQSALEVGTRLAR
jgi:hypothetical protein